MGNHHIIASTGTICGRHYLPACRRNNGRPRWGGNVQSPVVRTGAGSGTLSPSKPGGDPPGYVQRPAERTVTAAGITVPHGILPVNLRLLLLQELLHLCLCLRCLSGVFQRLFLRRIQLLFILLQFFLFPCCQRLQRRLFRLFLRLHFTESGQPALDLTFFLCDLTLCLLIPLKYFPIVGTYLLNIFSPVQKVTNIHRTKQDFQIIPGTIFIHIFYASLHGRILSFFGLLRILKIRFCPVQLPGCRLDLFFQIRQIRFQRGTLSVQFFNIDQGLLPVLFQLLHLLLKLLRPLLQILPIPFGI